MAQRGGRGVLQKCDYPIQGRGLDCKITQSPIPLGCWSNDSDWSFHNLYREVGLHLIHFPYIIVTPSPLVLGITTSEWHRSKVMHELRYSRSLREQPSINQQPSAYICYLFLISRASRCRSRIGGHDSWACDEEATLEDSRGHHNSAEVSLGHQELVKRSCRGLPSASRGKRDPLEEDDLYTPSSRNTFRTRIFIGYSR